MRLIRTAMALAAVASCASVTTGIAAEKPINLSLFTPVSIAKETDSVTAFRFNLLYGKNTSVEVVDLGLVKRP
ncbi:MAG: hypothetical protein L0Z51_03000 [Candidatus Latescibacteria bacterium]|nr:hypothetical protein [Candidatus Latescibacterota bacterium]